MIRVCMSYRSSRGSYQGGLHTEAGPPAGSLLHKVAPKPWRHKRLSSIPFIPRDSSREGLATADRPSSSPVSEGVRNIWRSEDEQRTSEAAAVIQKNERDLTDQTPYRTSRTSVVSEHTPRVTAPMESPSFPLPSSLSSEQDLHSLRLKLSRVSFNMESQNTAASQSPQWTATDARAIPYDLEVGLLDKQISQPEPTSSTIKWQRIVKLREGSWVLRSQIQEIRNNLRQTQYIKSAADDMLFRRINGVLHVGHALLSESSGVLSKGQKTLEELKDECQRARDAYGPLEDECNRLEDQLSRQEFKLTQLEKDFYGTSNEPPIVRTEQPARSEDPEIQQPGASSITSREDEIEDSEYHPLVTKYLSKLGDLDLHRERLDDLFDEKEHLEEERDSRLRFGLTLDPDDQAWLDNSQKELQELGEKIRLLEKEVEEMKQDCISKGLLDEYGEPTSFESQEEKYFVSEEDINPEDEKSEYVKYPLLLPLPGVLKHEDSGNYEPKPDERSDKTTNHINKWMLERLRNSPLDVNLLARTFEGIFGDTFEDWQFAVLYFWFRDGTVKTTAGTPVYTSTRSRSLTTQAPPEDLLSESSDSPVGKPTKEPSFRILVASSDRSDATPVAFFLGSSPNSPISPRPKTILEK